MKEKHKEVATKMTALVGAAAFANEFCGLVAHTFPGGDPFYSGIPRLFIDAFAVTAAGTVATLHSMHRDASLGDAVLDSSIPITLAFVVPTLIIPPLADTYQRMVPHRRLSRAIAMIVGIWVILTLSSVEVQLSHMAAEGADEETDRSSRRAAIASILVAILLVSVVLFRAYSTASFGDERHDAASSLSWRQGAVMFFFTALLFAGAIVWNMQPSSFHRVSAIAGGVGTIFCMVFAWWHLRSERGSDNIPTQNVFIGTPDRANRAKTTPAKTTPGRPSGVPDVTTPLRADS